jgi:diguanylate cyclase (GGDEF)-like protein
MPGRTFDDDDDGEITSITSTVELQREMASIRSGRTHAYLVVLAGSNVGEMYKLDGNEVVIGRSPQVSIRLSDEGISRRHARVVVMGNHVMLEDLQSANGTTVNGERVASMQLKDGDKIRLGSTTILKFTYHDKLDESFQQQMYEAALRDGLTKAFNKKYFSDRLETEFAYARRHKTILSLLMLDVDFFKKINDAHGHLAGDHVLMKVARAAQGAIRTEDVFARYGGEEFAVICRGIPLANAAVLGERLRALIESTAFDWESKRIPVTVSIGVAGLPETACDNPAGLIEAADQALYEAKRAGRNRVRLRNNAPPLPR